MKPTKTVYLDIFEGQILPWQIRARDSKARFKVLVAGRKARKTTFIVNKLVGDAAGDTRGLKYVYIAPFRKQAKKIVWDDHLGRILKLFNSVGLRYKQNASELTVRFDSGSTFVVDGQDNAEGLRGESDWAAVGADEYASWRPYVWQEIIRPNLQVHKAYCLIGGTPKGYGNDFYRMAKLGDHNGIIDDKPAIHDPEFETFYATSYDNMYTDREEIESAKRQSTLEFFNQEYLALFTRFTGLIYPEFEVSRHVHPVEYPESGNIERIFGLDFGVRGYTAALPAFVRTDGHVYIPENSEYKESGRTAKDNADAIKIILTRFSALNQWQGYADPSGWSKTQQGLRLGIPMVWSIADEYLEENIPIARANNEVNAGINYVKQLFKADRIHIDPTNERLIDEIMQYQWLDQPEKQIGVKNEPEKPRKFNDHLVDALRYMAYSKPTAPQEEKSNQLPPFPAKFELKIEEPSDDADQITPLDFPSIMG